MDHFRKAERLINEAEAVNRRYPDRNGRPVASEVLARQRNDFLGAIAHAVAGVLEVLGDTEPPLDDLMGGPPGSVQVPLLDLPMREDRKEAAP